MWQVTPGGQLCWAVQLGMAARTDTGLAARLMRRMTASGGGTSSQANCHTQTFALQGHTWCAAGASLAGGSAACAASCCRASAAGALGVKAGTGGGLGSWQQSSLQVWPQGSWVPQGSLQGGQGPKWHLHSIRHCFRGGRSSRLATLAHNQSWPSNLEQS